MSETGPIATLPPLPAEVPAGRIPGWRTERLVPRECPVCFAHRPSPLVRRPDGLVVALCQECGMRYLPEIPGDEDLEAFYRDYGEYKTALRPSASLAYRLLPIKPADPYLVILRDSGGLASQSLCEVGCSYGSFLRRARAAGAEVHGIELDDRALDALRAAGIPTAKEFQSGARFDIVCAFQLIEHLARPSEFVERAAEALRPDGRLLLALPNGGEAERVGSGWIGYRVDLEHLNYFSIATLARLLQRHNLLVEQFWECVQPNVPREGRRSRRPADRLRRLIGQWGGEFRAEAGTFVLVVLARKIVERRASDPRP